MELFVGLDWYLYFVLMLVAFVAGFVDSIAGGGGMITTPALLLAGIPPHLALGTNKLQSCFGSLSASVQFYKKGHLDIKASLPIAFIIFVASILGSLFVLTFSPAFLIKIVPLFLFLFGLYFLFSPRLDSAKEPKIGMISLCFLLSIVGFYDGFFGAGTGSFFIFILIALAGNPLYSALGKAKFFNFSSNIAALIIFALNKEVLFGLGILMGLAQFIGALLGARLAIKIGSKLIKPLVVGVCMIMCIKLIYEQI